MNAKSIPVITIDGPTASGKGTVAQALAQRLGFHYLDSGALYRLSALIALQKNIALDDEVALAHIASTLNCTFTNNDILLDGTNVAPLLRAEKIGNAASTIAALPLVRQALLGFQQNYCKAPGLVTDGRDMGTVVFPNAVLKVFLTASVEARAQRRYKQLIEKGFSANMSDLLSDLTARDARDQTRTSSPLLQAEGAYFLDTSDITAPQAVDQILSWYAAL